MEVSERVSEEGPGEREAGPNAGCRDAARHAIGGRAGNARDADDASAATGPTNEERRGLIVLARSASRTLPSRRPGGLDASPSAPGHPGATCRRNARIERYYSIRRPGRARRGGGVGETIARDGERRRRDGPTAESFVSSALAPRAEDASAGPEGKPSAMMHRDKGVCRYNRPPRVGRRTRVSTVTHLVERTAGAAAMVIEADAILNFAKSRGLRCDGRETGAPASVLLPRC